MKHTLKAMVVLLFTPIFCILFILGMVWSALVTGFHSGRYLMMDWVEEVLDSFGMYRGTADDGDDDTDDTDEDDEESDAGRTIARLSLSCAREQHTLCKLGLICACHCHAPKEVTPNATPTK